MARIEITATMANKYEYSSPSYAGYGYDTHYIYTLTGEDGKTYVWKTTTFLVLKNYDVDPKTANFTDRNDRPYMPVAINKGDVLRIKATVKGEGEYKGQPQTELTRVSVIERLFAAKTPEEIRAEKEAAEEARKKEQLDSLQDGDIVMKMPYRQYKAHYADCETVIDSYEMIRGHAYIKVIVRDGRLKASGVRGETYSGYEISYKEGEKTYRAVYRAVSEENALKRFRKEYGYDGECTKVYNYAHHRYF